MTRLQFFWTGKWSINEWFLRILKMVDLSSSRTVSHNQRVIKSRQNIRWVNWINYTRNYIIHDINIPSGKRLHNYGTSPYLMGKTTISTGPFSSSQTVNLPGRVHYERRFFQHFQASPTQATAETETQALGGGRTGPQRQQFSPRKLRCCATNPWKSFTKFGESAPSRICEDFPLNIYIYND